MDATKATRFVVALARILVVELAAQLTGVQCLSRRRCDRYRLADVGQDPRANSKDVPDGCRCT